MIIFEVPGIPVSQGNHRIGQNGHLYDSTVGLAQWRKDAAQLARITWRSRPVLLGAVGLAIVFKMPAPQDARRAPTMPPAIKRPDVSKMVRAVEDALTKIVYKDDSQIVRLEASKILVARDPGAIVFLEWAEAPHHHSSLIAGMPCELCGEPVVSALHFTDEAGRMYGELSRLGGSRAGH